MRPTSRSPASGRISTARSISMARSLTFYCPCDVTWRRRGASSPGRCAGTVPVEVTTDRAPVYPRVPDELVSSALHIAGQYANNPIEADHGPLKARLRPMRGVKRHRSARTIAAGHAFGQNLRRGHDDIATEVFDHHRLREAFDGLAITM
jgi:DDE domain